MSFQAVKQSIKTSYFFCLTAQCYTEVDSEVSAIEFNGAYFQASRYMYKCRHFERETGLFTQPFVGHAKTDSSKWSVGTILSGECFRLWPQNDFKLLQVCIVFLIQVFRRAGERKGFQSDLEITKK